MENMYTEWYRYVLECNRQRKELQDMCNTMNVPDGYKTALQLAEVNVNIEKKMSYLDGACKIIGLEAVFDVINGEIRIEKKGKILFKTNGVESNYDYESIIAKYIDKYGYEDEE